MFEVSRGYETPSLKKDSQGWRWSLTIQFLPNVCKAPGSDPSTSKENVFVFVFFYDVFDLDKTEVKLGQKRSNETSSPFYQERGINSEGELC